MYNEIKRTLTNGVSRSTFWLQQERLKHEKTMHFANN